MSADNALDALDAHLKAWDSPGVFETASGPDSAYEMLSEVMDDVRVLLSTEVQAEHPMITAYNSLFDWKDTQEPGSQPFIDAYEVLAYMARGMQLLGITIPVRFDAPREEAVETHRITTEGLKPKRNPDLTMLRALSGMPFPDER